MSDLYYQPQAPLRLLRSCLKAQNDVGPHRDLRSEQMPISRLLDALCLEVPSEHLLERVGQFIAIPHPQPAGMPAANQAAGQPLLAPAVGQTALGNGKDGQDGEEQAEDSACDDGNSGSQ